MRVVGSVINDTLCAYDWYIREIFEFLVWPSTSYYRMLFVILARVAVTRHQVGTYG